MQPLPLQAVTFATAVPVQLWETATDFQHQHRGRAAGPSQLSCVLLQKAEIFLLETFSIYKERDYGILECKFYLTLYISNALTVHLYFIKFFFSLSHGINHSVGL